MSTASRSRSSSGSIVAGPREQLKPDGGRAVVGEHPAGLDVVRAVEGRVGLHAGEGHHGRQPEFLAHLEADQRLAEEVVRLGDDEVDALLLRPAQLLAVLLAHDGAGVDGIGRVVAPGVADVAGDERPALGCDLVRDADGLPVHQLEVVAAADVAQLLAVGVVGQRHHDVGAGPQELAVQLPQRVRRIEDHLGHVRAGLDVAAAFELEDVALAADDHAVGEPLGEAAGGRTGAGHASSSGAGAVPKRAGIEAGDVVDRAVLQRELGEHAADPRGELVAGAAPADADVHGGEAGNGAEHELVVGDEVVVALVDVQDVGEAGVGEAGHDLRDEVGDVAHAGAVARDVRRVVVADLHRVDDARDDRVHVDAGVEVGDDRHGVGRCSGARSASGGTKYLASLGRSRVSGTCSVQPSRRRQQRRWCRARR